jgi:UDPglucose 6-dehydrogenase
VIKLKIGVVGLGKLGLPLSLVFAKAGFEVYGVDVNEQRIKEIRSFFLKCQEPKVAEYLQKYTNFEFSTDYQLLCDVPMVNVITQTPSLPNGYFDMLFVREAVEQIHEMNEDALIIVSSNVNIGTVDRLSKTHGRICYNPEFIAQGTIIHDFENPRFVVVGAYKKDDGMQVSEVWKKVHDKPIHIVKPIEAEIIKLSLNFSYSLGITFANMIGELCEKFSVNSCKLLDVIYQDRRNYKAGLGFGGPCFPKDVDCFRSTCKDESIKSGYRIADLLSNLNDYTIDKYVREIKSYNKRRIGVLGVAYKPNVPYTYNSQSISIIQRLETKDCEIYVYDPLAQEEAQLILRNAHYCTSKEECIERADVLFIGTPNFSNIDTSKPIINPWACERMSTNS